MLGRRQTVLESVDKDQDRAVDLLLGMSDPEFKSEAPPPIQQPQMVRLWSSLIISDVEVSVYMTRLKRSWMNNLQGG